MKKRIRKLLMCFLLVAATVFSYAVPLSLQSIQKESGASAAAVLVMNKNILFSAVPERAAEPLSLSSGELPVLSPEELDGLELCPGGMPFGVKFYTDGVTVVGFSDVETSSGKQNPASDAGLCVKDVIIKVDGEALTGASDLTERIESSSGRELLLLCRRGEREFEVRLRPVWCPSESRFKTGIWVRDSGAGIGTVTFVLPESGAFAGLGHGICDADTGHLIPMTRGTVSGVTISSVVKGAVGAPGELKGYFTAGKQGALLGNATCGVWGIYSSLPEGLSDPLPVGLRSDLEEGDAEILCTLASNRIGRYAVRISNINRSSSGSKCFTVTVTDPALLSLTGGIVQGMSGSPIIQNGKLVGAVTHVLINDPSVGYGIFLENMLVNLPLLVH